MNEKPFLVYIHGGTTFSSRIKYLEYLMNKKVSLEEPKLWNGDYLEEKLKKSLIVIRPKMPLKENARYVDWKIYFEKYLELIKQKKQPVNFLGYSLGAIFLVKYFSENLSSLILSSLHLVGPLYDNSHSLEELAGGFNLKDNFYLLEKQFSKIFFYFFKYDPIVDLYHQKKYLQRLPKAKVYILGNKKGHFRTEKFPELVRNILLNKTVI